jgi:hypothetical protein
MKQHNDIVTICLNDFDSLWYQNQAFAVLFAEAGYRVFYFNKTPQRWPKPAQVLNWFIKRCKNKQPNQLPQNLKIVNPFWLVPTKMLRPVNRILIRWTLRKLDIKNAIIITDLPSYNLLDAIEQIQPEKTVYNNVHNYDDSVKIVAGILDSEKTLIRQAEFLFADSLLNIKRLETKSCGRKIYRALPGVYFELFTKAFRGDEPQKLKTIYFYGAIRDELELALYNRLAERFKVVFIGETIGVEKNISKKIEIRPAVNQKELAEQLTDADIIGLFYKQDAYNKGIIPAKIFECLATGKPILVSGLEKDPVYSPHVYHFDGSQQAAVEIIKNLGQTETPEKIKNRLTAGKQADWKNRFEHFCNIVFAKSKDGNY